MNDDKKDFSALNLQTPELVMQIIQERDALLAKQEEEELQAKQKRLEKNRQEYYENWEALMNFVAPKMPDFIQQWIVKPEFDKNYNPFIVQIPGLAPIAMKWEKRVEVPYLIEIGVPAAWQNSRYNGEIDWHWNYGSTLRLKDGLSELTGDQYKEALYQACRSAGEMKDMLTRKAEEFERQIALSKREEQQDAEAANEQAQHIEGEKEEDEQLFDALKNDKVAVLLLKAFLAIRQERSAFESEVSEANDSFYSMESFLSSEAADLRRQAENADRRAREEADRARDLSNELDDAEAKLKKANRGW